MTVPRKTRARKKKMPSRTADPEVAMLRASFDGAVLTADDPGWEDARKVWNGMIEKRPLVIARCRTAADVKRSVDFARQHGLEVAIRGGGHNVSGCAVCDDGMVIDLRDMKKVTVDAGGRVAEVEGGATLGDIDRATAPYNLAVPSGLVTMTGIGGLSLRGGLGHLTRSHGLTADNIVSANVVTADGNEITASDEENRELLWALRGGSLPMGVVTSFRFRAWPVGSEVTLILRMIPATQGAMALRFLREFMATAPEDLSLLGLYANAPEAEPIPTEAQGKEGFVIFGCWTGDQSRADEVIAPLRTFGDTLLDLSGPVPYLVAQSAFDAEFPEGERHYWKSAHLRELSDEVIEIIHRYGTSRPTHKTSLDVWFLGGVVERISPEHGAFNQRQAPYLIGPEANWTKPSEDKRSIAWVRSIWDDVRRHSDGATYMNFAGFTDEFDALAKSSYGANYDRLLAVKAKYDPDDLF